MGMALTSIRLCNFKCFEDSGEIPLAPLTVIFGRNNTGKSSILQSLFLFRQTLDSPEHRARFNIAGPLYVAGGYSDIVYRHAKKRRMEFEFGVQANELSAIVAFKFSSDEPNQPRLLSLRIHNPDQWSIEFRNDESRPERDLFRSFENGEETGEEGGEGYFNFPRGYFLPIIGELPGEENKTRNRVRWFARCILDSLQKEVERFRAVGAFRQLPNRLYEYQGKTPEVVDLVGKNAINALIDDTRNNSRLLENLNQWIEKTGHIRVRPPRPISRTAKLYDLIVEDAISGTSASLVDSGSGVGQALPVFIEGLRTPSEALFLVQEPETHLHPDAVLAMADFLISIVRSGRRVIVETHSEQILLRIRHRIAGARTNGAKKLVLSPDEVSLIYVNKPPKGPSTATRLNIDKLGQIPDWPRDFMEETSEERLAIMEAMVGQSKAGRKR